METLTRDKKMLNLKEVASIFNISTAMAYRLIAGRKIPFYKAGRLDFGSKICWNIFSRIK